MLITAILWTRIRSPTPGSVSDWSINRGPGQTADVTRLETINAVLQANVLSQRNLVFRRDLSDNSKLSYIYLIRSKCLL